MSEEERSHPPAAEDEEKSNATLDVQDSKHESTSDTVATDPKKS